MKACTATAAWSAIFHWPTSRTYRFIQQLKTNGIIEIIPHNDTTALHIRVVNYENWTNISALLNEKKENTQKASNEKFRLFWDDYHNILQLPKENIAKAQRIWKKAERKRTAGSPSTISKNIIIIRQT
ncbi:hypothetical protein NXY15_25725 [Bacteroides thetaiotaomicron]|nr:hypothetical protein NXY15_25725 [Bacteroides thetaiotaomicron]